MACISGKGYLRALATDGLLFKLKETSRTDVDKLVVDGKIEIIEVKLGKSSLGANQVASYRTCVKRGYPLWFLSWHSLLRKKWFEIDEQLITNPKDVRCYIQKRRK